MVENSGKIYWSRIRPVYGLKFWIENSGPKIYGPGNIYVPKKITIRLKITGPTVWVKKNFDQKRVENCSAKIWLENA